MVRRVLAATLILLKAQFAFGVGASPQVNIDFTLSPVSKNLTQQSVIQTFQDSQGALWFVTQEGLNKYTGKNLENYRYSPRYPDSLSTDSVKAITEDTYGNIWIATDGGGLNRYDQITNSFSSIQFDPNDRDQHPRGSAGMSCCTSCPGSSGRIQGWRDVNPPIRERQ